MIKRLQKRFIVAAMTAITILIIVIVGATNVTNLMFTRRLINMQIETSDHSGNATENIERNERIKEKYKEIGILPGVFGKYADINDSVHFTVKLNSDKSTGEIDLSSALSVDKTTSERLIEKVVQSEWKSGIVEEFYFRYTGPDNNVLIFLYIGNYIDSIFRLAVLSLIVGILCWIIMFLIIVFLSKKAIKPFAENMERQRKFVTDAGHELKTPLAIILANTEALELYNGESKWSKNIRNQVERLDGLTKEMLALSKIESNDEFVMEKISLTQIVSETVDMFEESAAKKNLKFDTELQNITIKANKIQLNTLISILVDNAVKYSSANTDIKIRLRKKEDKIEFKIRNFCDVLPDCSSDELFERFYRGNDARTQQDGGYGIGLSAARAIVEVYSGTITAEYKDDNKICFKVIF